MDGGRQGLGLLGLDQAGHPRLGGPLSEAGPGADRAAVGHLLADLGPGRPPARARERDLDLAHSAAVHAGDPQLDPRVPHRVADLGHSPQLGRDEARQGRRALAEAQAQELLDLAQGDAALHQPAPLAAGAEQGRGVLARDVAGDLLDHVLEGDQPVRAAVLVHHQGQLLTALDHLAQQALERLGRGDEPQGADQLGQGLVLGRAQHVAGAQVAADVIEALALMDQDLADPPLAHELQPLGADLGLANVERDQVHAGGHDLVSPARGELHGLGQELRGLLLEPALGALELDEALQLLVRQGPGAGEPALDQVEGARDEALEGARHPAGAVAEQEQGRRRQERDLPGRGHRDRLGRHLAQHHDRDGRQQEAEQHPGEPFAAEGEHDLGRDAHQEEVDQEVAEEHRDQERVGSVQQLEGAGRPAPSAALEPLAVVPAQGEEGGLAGGEEGREGEEDEEQPDLEAH